METRGVGGGEGRPRGLLSWAGARGTRPPGKLPRLCTVPATDTESVLVRARGRPPWGPALVPGAPSVRLRAATRTTFHGRALFSRGF